MGEGLGTPKTRQAMGQCKLHAIKFGNARTANHTLVGSPRRIDASNPIQSNISGHAAIINPQGHFMCAEPI